MVPINNEFYRRTGRVHLLCKTQTRSIRADCSRSSGAILSVCPAERVRVAHRLRNPPSHGLPGHGLSALPPLSLPFLWGLQFPRPPSILSFLCPPLVGLHPFDASLVSPPLRFFVFSAVFQSFVLPSGFSLFSSPHLTNVSYFILPSPARRCCLFVPPSARGPFFFLLIILLVAFPERLPTSRGTRSFSPSCQCLNLHCFRLDLLH